MARDRSDDMCHARLAMNTCHIHDTLWKLKCVGALEIYRTQITFLSRVGMQMHIKNIQFVNQMMEYTGCTRDKLSTSI